MADYIMERAYIHQKKGEKWEVASIGDLDAIRMAHNKEDAEISYSIVKVVFIAVGTSVSLICLKYIKDYKCKK